MDFKIIKNENEHENEKYLLRAYGKKKGILLGTYESIKENCIKSREYCLVEKKTNYYVLCWDLDFKENLDKYYKENHDKITEYIIEKINESLDEIMTNANKDYVYAESTKGLGKHIYYILIITDKKLHLRLYDMIIRKIEKDKKYKKEIIEKIIDKSVCNNKRRRILLSSKREIYI